MTKGPEKKYTLLEPTERTHLDLLWVLCIGTIGMTLLKEFGLIDWSWWVVISPILAYGALVALVMFTVLALILFGEVYHWWRRRK